MKKVTIKTKK